MCGFTTTQKTLKLLGFTHFLKFCSFEKNSDNSLKKEFLSKFNVSVELDIVCVDTRK